MFLLALIIFAESAFGEAYRDLGEFSLKDGAVLEYQLPEGFYFNLDAPNRLSVDEQKWQNVNPQEEIQLKSGTRFRADIYYCEEKTQLCFLDRMRFRVLRSDERGSTSIRIPIQVQR